MTAWMQVYSGGIYHPLDPRPEEVNIADIAHALAYTNRYSGHARFAYSVAQHSVYVSDALPKELRLQGILHDAAEAYVGDITRPIKRMLPDFKEIEERNARVIFERFGVPYPVAEKVHEIDTRILLNEARDVMGGQSQDWEIDEDPIPGLTIKRWTARTAEMVFMSRFNALMRWQPPAEGEDDAEQAKGAGR